MFSSLHFITFNHECNCYRLTKILIDLDWLFALFFPVINKASVSYNYCNKIRADFNVEIIRLLTSNAIQLNTILWINFLY